VFLQTFSAFSASLKTFSQKQTTLFTQVKDLILVSEEFSGKSVEELKKELKTLILPIESRVGIPGIFNGNIEEFGELLLEINSVLRPLQGYSISSKGFVGAKPGSQPFTTSLEEVLNNLPQLQQKIQSFWNNIWLIRLLAGNTNSSLSSYLKYGQFVVDSIPLVFANKQIILEILGHYSSQRIVIFNQNTGEARPMGGFYGSYIPIDIFQGEIKIGQSQAIYYVDGQLKQRQVGHPTTWYYGWQTNDGAISGLVNGQYTSCFPRNAEFISKEWEKSGNGYTIDQMYVITPDFLKRLLPKDSQFVLDDTGGFAASNIIQEIEREAALQTQFDPNPKQYLSNFLSEIISQILSNLSTISTLELIEKILDSSVQRDLQIWFRNRDSQSELHKLGLDSSQTCNEYHKNVLNPVMFNISGDKRHSDMEHRVEISTESVVGGTKFTVNHVQTNPPVKSQARSITQFNTFNMLGYQIPSNAFNLKIQADDRLYFPFLRDQFFEIVEKSGFPEDRIIMSSEIETIIQTSREIDGGFSYRQADGGYVLGTYLDDKKVGDTLVKFEFTVPYTGGYGLVYYPQAGQNNTTLVMKENVRMNHNPNQSIETNRERISRGVGIISR
jgi:hypothetical protein